MVTKCLRGSFGAARQRPENLLLRLRFLISSRAAHSIQMQIRALRFHKEYRFKQSSS
jgi:hypothetical protein